MADKELLDKIDEMKRKIMILEWDKDKNQLNPGKKVYLDNLKKEYIKLKEEMEK